MIAHLSGTILSKHATSVVLDVAGVGYEVTIPVSTFYDMEEPGAQLQLRIYTHVREDALQLFGFRTSRERELFTLLISVSGIGPRSAIAMLSGMSADEIIAAIRTNNYARLTSIPGVGRKTGERLVIELRDKMAALSTPALDEQMTAAPGAPGAPPSEDALRDDALSALLNLGYQRAAAERAISQAASEGGGLSVELLLRRSLRHLSKG
jgi:Holliday junction DNA helicase RuvA